MIAMYWPDVKAGWVDARRSRGRGLRPALAGWWDYRLGYLIGWMIG